LEAISSKNFEALADYVEQHGEVRAGGKTAFVVSGDLEYGISRMIKSSTEIRDIPLDSMGFRSMKKAVHWLEEDE
jgi:hypothetical protein